jgi:hypothetical protein
MRRLAREYAELPGLSLTITQVQRLLHVDLCSAREIVAAFTRAGCLIVACDGRVRRPSWMSGSGWRARLFYACPNEDRRVLAAEGGEKSDPRHTAALHYVMT